MGARLNEEAQKPLKVPRAASHGKTARLPTASATSHRSTTVDTTHEGTVRSLATTVVRSQYSHSVCKKSQDIIKVQDYSYHTDMLDWADTGGSLIGGQQRTTTFISKPATCRLGIRDLMTVARQTWQLGVGGYGS